MMVAAVSSSRGWRILHWLLAVLFVIIGVVGFLRLGDTFESLAAVMSFYFIFRGSFDIAMAFAGSRLPGWWVLLLVGLAEIAIGFWAAGSWKVSVVVLVSWLPVAAVLALALPTYPAAAVLWFVPALALCSLTLAASTFVDPLPVAVVLVVGWFTAAGLAVRGPRWSR